MLDAESDDASLMRAYAAGSMAAFEQLYARHRAPLFRYLFRHTRDRELSNDLFQEVWSRVVNARTRYEARSKFQAFLFSIAHNCLVDHHRRMSARPVLDGEIDPDGFAEGDLPSPEQELLRHEERARLRAALGALPQPQRDTLLLYEETGLSLDEIAEVTGVGAETAKSRLRYAVGKLRAALRPAATEGAG